MRLAWATDLQFNYPYTGGEDGARRLCDAARGGRGLLITGAIADAQQVERWLRFLQAELKAPIWFVLGGHDYHRSSIAEVRERIRALCRESKNLTWMQEAGVVPLTAHTALVGVDGWEDARLGVWGEVSHHRRYGMVQVQDLSGAIAAGAREGLPPSLWRLRRVMRKLGDEAARALAPSLRSALERFEEVIVLTHVPPFAEAAWHDGHLLDAKYLPFVTCAAVGEVLLEAAETYPQRNIRVLCGLTHSGGVTRPRPNLEVRTGHVKFGWPRLVGGVKVR